MKSNPITSTKLSRRQVALYAFLLLVFGLVFTPIATSLLIPEVMSNQFVADFDGQIGTGVGMMVGSLVTLFLATRA